MPSWPRLPAAQPIGTVELITEDRRTQGKDGRARFRKSVSNVRGSIVEILDGDEPVALGTVVDAAGLVITKASELPDRAACRLPGGRVTGAQVVGVDPAYDLALVRVVRIPPAGLVPVTWAKTADPPAGTSAGSGGNRRTPCGSRRREHPPPGHARSAPVGTRPIPAQQTRRRARAHREHCARHGLPGRDLRRERGCRGHSPGGCHPDDRGGPGTRQ